MYSMSKLAIRGHQGEELPNTFFRQDGPSDHLAIVLPGLGYTVHMPVLYYPTLCLLSRGADVLWVQYDYTNLSPQDIKQPGWRRRFGDDVDAAYEAGLVQRSYSGLSLIGKSLGTMAIAHLLARGSASQDPHLAEARCVWLTPLLRDEWIREQISRAVLRSLAIIGTADPQYEPDLLARCGLTIGAGSLEIPNANHSLEIERDVPGSVRAMEQMVLTLEAFLQLQQGLEHA
jgi:hypothetical protein